MCSGDREITSTILQMLMEWENKALDEKWRRFMALGLVGCSYVGLQDASYATLATL
ncbi:hypothetical protein EDB19DRAFT_1778103, partial [Suillus lakei]